MLRTVVSLCLLMIGINKSFSQVTSRLEIPLLTEWFTIAHDSINTAFDTFINPNYDISKWKKVEIPHNWDTYEGYRRLKHGNRHGTAWYRKAFSVPNAGKNKQYFLFFEGVGSFATVWVNGIEVGKHAGGRTTFTLNITSAVLPGKKNILAVKAEHPSHINTLPWVCGGCSDEWGFSEGSQPMGIFRPVSLIVTNSLRIQPFGVHIWNDSSANENSAILHIHAEIKNYAKHPRTCYIIHSIYDKYRKKLQETRELVQLNSYESKVCTPNPISVTKPVLWSLENPYLYTLRTEIIENGKIIDAVTTTYGIRTISWPIGKSGTSNQFLLNGKPVFINGTAEYEHNMGQSHAFSDQQIHTRVMQVKAAGYNAFRDAHQPHNIRYHANWDSLGLLWWPQFAAHIWFDNPEFKTNFKQLLTDWVKERRNSPSIILWGLENESTLPTKFAQECSDIIRNLDPTTSSQRKINTCNGGTGTDWNVVQNWSGTYGGNPDNYAAEMKKQLLNGEYGAWRSIDLHTEGPYIQNGILSEDRFTLLMESKIRLAESVRDSMCGQFHWLLNSHENPGRVQNGEGFRDCDRIGPVNYKGIFTPWGEPVDGYYMFRANYAPVEKEPMVYIVSHTWPNRWTTPGIKDSIIIYSNCDEVELFNDIENISLGRKSHKGKGTHFQWDGVPVHYNVLYAKGYHKGKPVATDLVMLNHLPAAPGLLALTSSGKNTLLQPEPGYNYIYRVNCGGPDYTDSYGNQWLADRQKTSGTFWGSQSWTHYFEGLPPFFGSQRRIFDPIKGTVDAKLFQSFRYGRDKLSFEFPLPDGEYLVELFFIEPWYGPNTAASCNNWRIFDVAVNNHTYIHNLDIYREHGYLNPVKKKITATSEGGMLKIHFPKVLSGQAVISAIAIASKNSQINPAPSPETNIHMVYQEPINKIHCIKLNTWLDVGDNQYADSDITINTLPPPLFCAEWIQTSMENKQDTAIHFSIAKESDVYVAIDSRVDTLPLWLQGFTDTKTLLTNNSSVHNTYKIYTRRYQPKSKIITGTPGKQINNLAHMYTIAVVPVSKLEDAADLRPVVRYEAVDARISGAGIKTGDFNGKKHIHFAGFGADTAEWTINPGLAGTYTLKFRYINTTDTIIPMQLKIIDAYGIELLNTRLNFPTGPTDKWRLLTTNTGGYINAGTYRIIVIAEKQNGLWLNTLEVQ